MPTNSETFVDYVTPVPAVWLNDVNNAIYNAIGTGGANPVAPTTPAQVVTNLGINPVSVKTYGAIGNGIADDTAAIQAAENAASTGGFSLYFPAGTYSINASGIQKKSNVSWYGNGFGDTTIQAQATSFPNGLVYGNGLSDFVITGLTFDWTLATYTLIATVNLNTCSDYSIYRCNFIGEYFLAFAHNGGNRFYIRDNTFYRTNAGGGAQCQSIEISDGSATCSWGVIQNNYMSLAGMNFSGLNCLIDSNKVYNHQFGGGITTEQKNTCAELTITNNTVIGGQGEDVNFTICLGIENWAPRSLVAGNHCEANAGDGISNGGQNCIIANNHCVNNGQMSGNGITSRYSSGSVNGNYSCYIGNECVDTQSTHTQNFGYADYNSSVFGNFISGNTFENNANAPMNILGTNSVATPIFQAFTTYNPGAISNGTSAGGTITCNGATPNDFVNVSFQQGLQGVRLWGWVSSTNQVSFRFENYTGGTVTFSNAQLSVSCQKTLNSATY